MTLNCKSCGAPLPITEEKSTSVCEYCDSVNTLPKLNNDRKINLYERASGLLRNKEFDKAMGLYEEILRDDISDAEIYWSIVCCRFGVEYVKDPATGRGIPTINRAQYTSIFDDEDYKQAIKYADEDQKSVYEEEAKIINEIQKGFLKISQSEDPFDIFICYKETDENGRRTLDSVLATDLYEYLTREGFKVFFARITLEDKLGSAYEPYIFAALNSAKVMVVLGTKPEYFNAVWVKNEWSRYLALIRQGEKKSLVPAYKDMDPRNLPEEFSHLQAQDMSKLGYMQDLVRGIRKIGEFDKPKEETIKTVTYKYGGDAAPTSQTEALLKRVFIFLEDGDWSNANTYCEKVLDIDPENAMAYMGKLMANHRVRNENELKALAVDFTGENHFLKAVRYADVDLKNRLSNIGEVCKNKEIYETARSYMDVHNISNLQKKIESFERAISIFEQIENFGDSRNQIGICREQIRLNKSEIDRIETEKQAEIDHKKAVEAAKKARELAKKRAKIIALLSVVAIAIVSIFVHVKFIAPAKAYKKALQLQEQGKYVDAIDEFALLSDKYKRNYDKEIDECKSEMDKFLKNSDDALAIKALYEKMDPYRDHYFGDESWVRDYETYQAKLYERAVDSYSLGEYVFAGIIFEALEDYSDSKKRFLEIASQKEYQKNAPVGSSIVFGSYEQDNNLGNGSEGVEWIILSKNENKVLLISKYVLDKVGYDFDNFKWSRSYIKKWLMETFYNNAFSEAEKNQIQDTAISGRGAVTYTKVFILWKEEILRYLPETEDRIASCTEYAIGQGLYSQKNEYYNIENACYWWALVKDGDWNVNIVDFYGNVEKLGTVKEKRGVRPAMWIDLGN